MICDLNTYRNLYPLDYSHNLFLAYKLLRILLYRTLKIILAKQQRLLSRVALYLLVILVWHV